MLVATYAVVLFAVLPSAYLLTTKRNDLRTDSTSLYEEDSELKFPRIGKKRLHLEGEGKIGINSKSLKFEIMGYEVKLEGVGELNIKGKVKIKLPNELRSINFRLDNLKLDTTSTEDEATNDKKIERKGNSNH